MKSFIRLAVFVTVSFVWGPSKASPENCFFPVASDGQLKKAPVSFRQILSETTSSDIKRISRDFQTESVRAALEKADVGQNGLVFVWDYQFCPAVIFQRQLAFKEYVWAQRAAAILVARKGLSDPLLENKLRILRQSTNQNRRVDFPIYIVDEKNQENAKCGMGILHQRLFQTGVENNFIIQKTESNGKTSFSLRMMNSH